MRKIKAMLLVTTLAFAVIACSGSGTRMIQSHMEEQRLGEPIKNVLIIAVIDNQEIRSIFEKHLMQRLHAMGVEANISAGVLPVESGSKLEKEVIIEVVNNNKNDTILITHILAMEASEVFSRGRPRYFNDYYGFYNYAGGYVTWPTVYGEKVQLRLETRLYDVKTESLIWSGESLTTNPETTGKAIGQVVDVVIKDLVKNGLLPQRLRKKLSDRLT